MSLEIKVPPVGESITEVVLSRWIKNDGDAVEMDEAIAELESDKATFELTAEKAGVLKTIAKEGDTLPIGAVVCSIEEGGAAPAKKEKKPLLLRKKLNLLQKKKNRLPMQPEAHRRQQPRSWPKKVWKL
jgi:2-oxoglutarate dehydrogenase E2 component (dihydrolipoamide succinyltransferase)